ncbi:MAG TPA: cbb3-type cytochrome c oxidase subunit 3 [Ramlibacter sp.]|nr:cbb3-type cytochrome c oxidase subunit 3 [Ramlibacter sp.]HVZ43412.1 cbb3-type cytochrome c oxidase subunit 3 [Ramlibacter sp.]
MDITTLRIAATVLSFVTFVGILAWVYLKPHGRRFEEAARLPFEQD